MARRSDSWQTRSVADWLPREPAPLAEVVDDNNVAVKKIIVVSSSQRPVLLNGLNGMATSPFMHLAECLKALCLLRLDYMQWPYPSLI